MKTKIALLIVMALALPLAGLHAYAEVCETTEPSQSVVPAEGQGPIVVGEYINGRFESPHPYPAAAGNGPQMVFSQEINHPGAAYVAPHFGRMELAPGDYVVIRAPDGRKRWQYERFGTADLGRHGQGGFWGVHVNGPTAIVELWSSGGKSAFGFEIDQYARGFTDEEMGYTESGESICFGDDKEDAICYSASHSLQYQTARAVARLTITGVGRCTGWLVGDEGHLITNEHCIANQAAANNTTYEFMAEAATCGGGAANGTVEATSATYLSGDAPLDYAYVLLPTNVSPTYGFMQLRTTGAVLEERIYSPQHAGGRDKEIAIFSTYPENPSGFSEVDSINEPACAGGGPLETGYFMDTEGGSSGSPVLGWDDNCVISLHHCRGSGFCTTGTIPPDDPNRGVPIELVIADIGMGSMPASSFCIDDPDAIFADGFESGDFSGWDDIVIIP